MMMLVAAKWRDFSQQNPHTEQPDYEANEEPEYQPKSSTSRHKVCVNYNFHEYILRIY